MPTRFYGRPRWSYLQQDRPGAACPCAHACFHQPPSRCTRWWWWRWRANGNCAHSCLWHQPNLLIEKKVNESHSSNILLALKGALSPPFYSTLFFRRWEKDALTQQTVFWGTEVTGYPQSRPEALLPSVAKLTAWSHPKSSSSSHLFPFKSYREY